MVANSELKSTIGSITLGVAMVFLITFLVTTRIQKTSCGYGHVFLILLSILAIPSPLFNHQAAQIYTKLKSIAELYFAAVASKDQERVSELAREYS